MKDHPKCKTCKKFSPNVDEWDAPPGFGMCGLIEMSCYMTEWDETYDNVKILPEYKDHLASVMDGSSYKANLHVHPDYYCPMHSDLMPELSTRQ